MGKGKHKLAPRFVATVKGIGKLKRYGDGHGLYLVVRATGTKSWSYIWIKHGRRREIGLGSADGAQKVTLAQARVEADKKREQIAAGLDPFRERSKEAPKTFGDVSDILIATLESGWTKPKQGAHWYRMAEKTKAIRKIPVREINVDDLIKILQPIFTDTPETGRRMRSMIERVLGLATSHGWREGDNPAKWKNNLADRIKQVDKKASEKGHFAAMPYTDVPAFITALQTKDTIPAMALAFTILTASRTSEALNAVWDEFDLEGREWAITADRMKRGKAHTVPLSDQALGILRPLYETRTSQYVFAGQRPNRPLSNMSMAMIIRRMKIEGATVHGFRSAFKDYCSDKLNYADDVSEFALAHGIPDSTKAAYRRLTALDKRKHLMQDWANYCYQIEPENVVRLHG